MASATRLHLNRLLKILDDNLPYFTPLGCSKHRSSEVFLDPNGPKQRNDKEEEFSLNMDERMNV